MLKRFFYPCLSLSIALLSSWLLAGCSTAILAQRGPYLRAYHEGELSKAEGKLTHLADQELPDQCYTQSKEASWILLDRATTRFALNKTDEAIQDYAKALEALDYYSQELPTEQLAQMMLQDETGAYQAADFEQILARVYFALALLHKGDESNAYAILRQAEDYQQEKQHVYAKVPFTRHYRIADNGLSKFLFGVLLEKRGDLTNARILYDQAARVIPCTQQASLQPADASPHQATIIVLCHNGNAPYKISATSPASVASALALECLLATQRIDPAWSTLSGIPVPALRQWPDSYPLPTYAAINCQKKPLLPFYSIKEAASEELKQKMPVIVARGVARLLLRRCAVGYIERQDPNLGALADLTMLLINENTRADTRSWTTLPAFIDTARFDVEPGIHALSLEVYERNGVDKREYQLHLRPRDLCIIHVFNIHPGVRQILIPHRYLATQGESYE
ncbi:hypothetical protein [Candidatus Protochlamydia phocaeensis]|uniref:hypothetical protein n=1 Tax=Candidatus Protochlamydia phocaeensis TaxID=1414722 RepID=UPI000838E625|nr:hypothetical protein [Candidatus Protochlamydia phocaeensis]